MSFEQPSPDANRIPAIAAIGVSKRYGRHAILEDVHLTVRSGEVYALTGPNGAGKTTLIRTLTGLAFPTGGQVYLLGQNVHDKGSRARAHLGAVVEAPAKFYPRFTGQDNLTHHAHLAAMAPGAVPVGRDRIRDVLAQVELTHMAHRPVADYSLGQRQRLGVAAAILARPRVLILDEPTSGLDPLGISLIHQAVSDLAAAGGAVLLSSHHLREIAGYAHTVGILSSGRIVDTVDLRARQRAYRFRVTDPARAADALRDLPFVRAASARTPYVLADLRSDQDVPRAWAALTDAGHAVYEAGPDLFDLQEYYRGRIEA
ncbi:ABC transporter ATP-binding protein [Deinococcus soli (ex Cha et al. 2016)]|uniref:ABC-2 type transport system ATP-binding protein n=2 Tax=Deinococcus soli (ex Cha et al. 2016) TaxID=1309411 RepID=A0AAE4BM73_9DEIO|nr:ABC transporter ATP-binding protein [Deinococcus soli (ex Cha et al. 2016)]MDR6218780.1 ABC-2 type transport system ATP-binding protein [Deinococcus soli (ex Cha et al. 2016)]MDR6328577.1 ABC-2 type transport system ATP-binding protein [Deinococcus soli (ex Cha et al. 2016)]MDR6751936.1 ABC-2 type transport system ATP-binding protein [Deinococcus soli (ex Cha et al. 2016)]